VFRKLINAYLALFGAALISQSINSLMFLWHLDPIRAALQLLYEVAFCKVRKHFRLIKDLKDKFSRLVFFPRVVCILGKLEPECFIYYVSEVTFSASAARRNIARRI
jgi:hypothetical protein